MGRPHARGGVSRSQASAAARSLSSPRPWGCFSSSVGVSTNRGVVPTPVGVFRRRQRADRRHHCRPHARGGVSLAVIDGSIVGRSSPRPWGCFCWYRLRGPGEAVVPTPVGVFPMPRRWCAGPGSRPHARGGVSAALRYLSRMLRSSPRPWGCFHARVFSPSELIVVPTPVGVFPSVDPYLGPRHGRPHARGGVSSIQGRGLATIWSSPRPWGACCGM